MGASDQALRIPERLRDWGELNRRVAGFSQDAYARIEEIERDMETVVSILQRMSAYGGLAIDGGAGSAPGYSGSSIIIEPWDSAYPGANGDAALFVELDAAAGTIKPLIPGVYQFSASISGDGSTGADYTIDLYENNQRLIGFSVDQSNQSSSWTLSASFMVDFQGTETLDLRITATGVTTIETATFGITKTGLVDSDLTQLTALLAPQRLV